MFWSLAIKFASALQTSHVATKNQTCAGITGPGVHSGVSWCEHVVNINMGFRTVRVRWRVSWIRYGVFDLADFSKCRYEYEYTSILVRFIF